MERVVGKQMESEYFTEETKALWGEVFQDWLYFREVKRHNAFYSDVLFNRNREPEKIESEWMGTIRIDYWANKGGCPKVLTKEILEKMLKECVD